MRFVGFASGNSDKFYASKGEEGKDEGLRKGRESTDEGLAVVEVGEALQK